jgi:hypothetical protein
VSAGGMPPPSGPELLSTSSPPAGPKLVPTVSPPPPRRCEYDSARLMLEQFGFHVGSVRTALLVTPDGPDYLIVREGPVALWVGSDWGRMTRSFTVHGWLTLGRDRVHAHFTQLRTAEGHVYPVCMVMLDQADQKPGVLKKPESGPDYARVFATVRLEAVSRLNE